MTGPFKLGWLDSISIGNRFHIMLAILLLTEALIVGGTLRAMHVQVSASTELARIAAVQRALDATQMARAELEKRLHSNASGDPHAAPTGAAGPLEALALLRASLASVWALPKNPDVATLVEGVCLREIGSEPRRIGQRARRIELVDHRFDVDVVRLHFDLDLSLHVGLGFDGSSFVARHASHGSRRS